jgi:Carboxypeptidase regulatory-like domain
VLIAVTGCAGSDRIRITGRVTRKDGSPVVGAKVTFRSPRTGSTAMGFTDEDGRYNLGTATVGEGIPPEGYYITVFEDRGPVTSPTPPTINQKYTSYSDSGLKFKVQEGGESTFDMVLDPP